MNRPNRDWEIALPRHNGKPHSLMTEIYNYIEDLEKYCDELEIIHNPKHPNNIEYVEPYYSDETGFSVGKCPVCGQKVSDFQNFCDECGQKLDWKE